MTGSETMTYTCMVCNMKLKTYEARVLKNPGIIFNK